MIMAQSSRIETSYPSDIDFYQLLEVRPDASVEDITAAYHRQMRRYDRAQAETLGDEFAAVAAERRALLERAYATLSDPRSRYEYDRRSGLVGDAATDRQGVSNREITFAVAGVLVGLLVLAGLWAALGRAPATGPAVTEVNYPAQPISLRTLDGDVFNLEDHRGKVVLVNFWRTDCEPCKEETPDLQEAHRRLADQGLVIVGVDLFDGELALGKSEQHVREFVSRYGVEYPIALDETGQVARDYRLYPIPVSYFIDRDGNVRYIRIGQLTTSDVEELFRRL
jgi:cytochrome c biogenesis protein CcmG, thiol:disulfide interchange protein DsbE